jgi:6-phosphogluconolactonase (cycloisomerase 2 family)
MFTVNQASGKLTKTDDVVSTGSPVCIVFRAAA